MQNTSPREPKRALLFLKDPMKKGEVFPAGTVFEEEHQERRFDVPMEVVNLSVCVGQARPYQITLQEVKASEMPR